MPLLGRKRKAAIAVLLVATELFFANPPPKKKKRKSPKVWVRPFLLRRDDPTCDTLYTLQREFLLVRKNTVQNSIFLSDESHFEICFFSPLVSLIRVAMLLYFFLSI